MYGPKTPVIVSTRQTVELRVCHRIHRLLITHHLIGVNVQAALTHVQNSQLHYQNIQVQQSVRRPLKNTALITQHMVSANVGKTTKFNTNLYVVTQHDFHS
jgi:hypothetical protein